MDKARNGKMAVNFCVNVLTCTLEDTDAKKGVYRDWDVYVLGKVYDLIIHLSIFVKQALFKMPFVYDMNASDVLEVLSHQYKRVSD